MSTPADAPPLAWLWRRWHLPAAMRVRRRWSSYARQTAVSEILSQMALAAEEGANLSEVLWLTARSPIRPVSAVPAFQITVITVLSLLMIFFLAFPFPVCAGALMPGVFLIGALRRACRQSQQLHRIPLVESELAHLLGEALGSGRTLSQAMMALPKVFSPAQAAVVRAGEESGDLAPALRCLAREASVRQEAGVLNFYRIYPLIALSGLSALAAIIVMRVFPKLAQVFNQLGIEFPRWATVITRVLTFEVRGFEQTAGTLFIFGLICLYVDHLVRLHLGRVASALICAVVLFSSLQLGPWVLGSSVGFVLFSVLWVLSPQLWGAFPGEVDIDPLAIGSLLVFAFAIPVLADLIRGLWALGAAALARLAPGLRRRRCTLERANFLSSLGLMLSRRVPAPEALRLAAPTLGPAGLQGLAARAAEAVERGEAIERALARMHLLRGREEILLRLAAEGRDLAAELGRLGDDLAEQARVEIARSERVMRPIAVLAVALLTFPLLCAVYAPLFRIASCASP